MASKVPKLLLDALGAIAAAREFVAGISFNDYVCNKMRRSAVERQREILGEASARLAREQPSYLVSIANLKLAIDLRNRIIHGDDAVDDEVVYLTVTQDLEVLQLDLQSLLHAQRNGS